MIQTTTFLRSVVLTIALFLAHPTFAAKTVSINGAGATFPYPLYSQWGYQYGQETGVKFNYQSIGSGGGIAQIKAKTVDFGASDAPLTAQELDAFGLMQFPMVVGGVVPVINLPGITDTQLKITPEILAKIFLGEIKKWNAPLLQNTNPDLKLPDQDITVVHRADGSGTTWIFTNYLSAISKDWSNKVGTHKDVAWPVGVGGKGNEGVSAYIQRIVGSIGYVEYAYALQNKMTSASLQNKDGVFVPATMATFQAAATHADWQSSPGYAVVLTNQPGADSWPITGASFILLQRKQSDGFKAKEVLKFFDWCYQNGSKTANELNYVAMPQTVAALVRIKWTETIQSTDQASVWP